MKDDPWAGLTASGVESRLSARRINDSRWDFFWARDWQDRRVLLLSLASESLPPRKLPRLKEVEVRRSVVDHGARIQLCFVLVDPLAADVFSTLCWDIAASTAAARNEREAASIAISRTWRWHQLLRGSRPGVLTESEQLGLIGELEVLRTMVMPAVGPLAAINSWQGPLRAPRDFELGGVALEVKSRRSGSKPEVRISSESQLDAGGDRVLILTVLEVSIGVPGADHSLTDFVEFVRSVLETDHPEASDAFESRLQETGFNDEDDYSEWAWDIAGSVYFIVRGDFPRIEPKGLPDGLSKVAYSLSLSSITDFEIGSLECLKLLRNSHGE